MQMSPIELCLNRVASGDCDAFDELCNLLAACRCHLPINKIERDQHSATVSAVVIDRNARLLIPLFTSEDRYYEWSNFVEHEGDVLSLLGGEICSVLGAKGVLIDPLSDDAVELSPDLVMKVAAMSVEPESLVEDVSGVTSIDNEEAQTTSRSTDPFSDPPPGHRYQNVFEQEPVRQTYPHDGTPESFNPDAMDPVTATLVSETGAFDDAIAGTAELHPDGQGTQIRPRSSTARNSDSPKNKARKDRDREKKKRSFFGFFRGTEK